MTQNPKDHNLHTFYQTDKTTDVSPPSGLREPIAIIGIGCRFPGDADSPEAFWKLLCDGVDAISEVPAERWNVNTFYDPNRKKPGKIHSRWGGFIKNLDKFDPHFFGISPREAARMDPQQRLLLEIAWEALENAGQVPSELVGSNSGVFIGISAHDYSDIQLNYSERDLINAYTNLGGAMSIAANRISYVFNFQGPSMAVDTACSSSLVAVHLACQSIWNGESTLALAGGVHAILKPEMTIGFSKASMLSPDGRCKSFDARANGYVRAEGAGVVVLKPLSSALADGDPVVAVIRNTAVNQDGRTKGITVPNGSSQMAMLRQAYQKVGIDPSNVQYIEAHGTGTPVGDPIEVKALGEVLSQNREPEEYCLIGSVKSNIGHLEAGSGIAGLIKAALCLKHRQIPPNLHFETPNPDIPFDQLQLRVPQRLELFPNGKGPRIAGVNSFGFGGTNAHVVLQEAPETGEAPPQVGKNSACLLPLSARSLEALQAMAQRYRDFFDQGAANEASLTDICATASLRRGHHNYRLAVVGASNHEMAEHLDAFLAGESRLGMSSGRAPRTQGTKAGLVFVFSGMGQQWWAMGRELWHEEPVFREIIEQCDALLRPYTGWSLKEELLADEARSRITETHIAQPALFALQVALAALWRSWGVQPSAIVGHSVGEVAAAHVAGVLSLEDAIQVIYHRSRLQAKTAGQGKMLAVGLSEKEARRRLIGFEARVSIAAINSPRAVTLSGDADALEQIANSLEPDIFKRLLQVEVPYHSPKMELIKAELRVSLQNIKPQPASTPLFSTVTGQVTRGPEWDAAYWWQNVRNPVRFAEACDSLTQAGFDIFLEVGAHPVLAHSMKELRPAEAEIKAVLPSLRRKKADRVMMLASFGHLYTLGYPVDWNRLYAHETTAGGRFVRLPSYPWQRERYWNESEVSQQARLVDEQQRAMLGQQTHPLLGAKLQSAHPVWDAEIDTQRLTFLSDHAIQGSVVYPAAAYVEMALAAVPGGIVEEIEFHKALFLPDGPVRLQFVLNHDNSFDIYSGSKQEWVRHAHGFTRRNNNTQGARSEQPSKSVALDEIRERLTDEISGTECYREFHEMGLEYGPFFQGIERLWRGQTEALGAIAARKRVEVGNTQLSSYHLHPTILDACFQVLLGVMAFDERKTLYLPVRIKRLRVRGEIPSGSFFCHARLVEQSATHLEGDINLFDDAGNLLVEIQGLRCNQLAGQTNSGSKTDDYLYEYQWERSADPDLAIIPTGSETFTGKYESGSWLIFADSQGVAEQLAEQFGASGEIALLISPGDKFERLSPSSWLIRPDHAADYEQLLKDAHDAFDASQPIRGVVHLWSLDMGQMSRGTFMSDQTFGCVSVLYLVQALSQMRETPRTILVTRGTQAIGDDPVFVSPRLRSELRSVRLAQSPLWGLGRVIMNEQAQLRCTLVDLTPPGAQGQDNTDVAQEIQGLFHELLSDNAEDEIAWRGAARYVHRLRRVSLANHNHSGQKGPFYLDPSNVGIDNLIFRATTRREPALGEVEIEVYATGLNFKDVAKAMGLLDSARLERTFSGRTLGLECAGKIVAVGADTKFKIGDEVFGLAPNSFATYAITDARFVRHKPAHFTFEEAATMPIVFLTAYYALHELGRLRAGERVLIHSATGGVGLAALQLAQQVGVEVLATAGNPEKRAFLRDLGVKLVMDSRSLAFADEVMAYTNGQGVDFVLNTLPGETIASSISILSAGGRFIDISNIYSDSKVGLRAFQKGLSFFAFDLDQLMRSRPDFVGSLFGEAMQYVSDKGVQPLPHRTFPISDAASAFRYMAQAKHIGKIALSFARTVAQESDLVIAPNPDMPITFDASATYLITGGLGGFGLATAAWMVEHGARHIVLMGRSQPSEHAQVAIEAMQEVGAEVKVATADVTHQEQVARVLADISPETPLRGIIHAANVYDDAVLLQLDQKRFQKVMAPKAIGAWTLHTETLNRPLDFFVLFSSITSLVGNPGQANYVAANAFLDALAHYRHAQGLPALTINWGAVADAGYVAKNRLVGEHLKRIGITPLPQQQLLEMLGQLLRVEVVQTAVAAAEWQKWATSHPAGASPRFSDLVFTQSAYVTDTEQSGQDVESQLRAEVAKILGTSPAKLDISEPLTNLGLDSLMAVDLTNGLKNKLGLDVPTMTLLGGVSVAQLTAKLVKSESAPASPASVSIKASIDGSVNGSVSGRSAEAPSRSEEAKTPQASEISVMNEFYPKGTLSTLIELLRWRATHQPNQRAYTYLVDGEREEVHLTYGELDLKARAIAAQLQQMGATGERALLLYPSGLEFISAFFGCLYAGVVAVPTYPPRRNRPDQRLQAIATDSQATVALTTTAILSDIERLRVHTPELTTMRWLDTDQLEGDLAFKWQDPALVSSETLAFLQYTSGSTGIPKGVMVTHGNLLHNEQMIQKAFGHTSQSIVVGWLPLFHDMGLIGNVLQPLYLGIECILMSPIAVMQKPVRWLEAISRYKATTSGGPNFAYDLCVQKITPEQRASLDLSSWEVAFNGAEPVRAETLERFAAAFEPCGFRHSAFYPCYGMAETTLMVSGGLKTAPPILKQVEKAALEQNKIIPVAHSQEEVQPIVGCGQSKLEIAIVDPTSLTRCAVDQVGEIWVSGPSVAQGYWNRPGETKETFHAYLRDSGQGPFLRSGDVGFLQDNELFITGRLKDLIIIRGRNHYPQDIELTVEKSHPALRPGCGAAFSLFVSGEERLVIAQEVKRTFSATQAHAKLDVDQVVAAIRRAVSEQHQLQVYAVLLLKTGTIPKTSSGKIQRRACRAGFEKDTLSVVGQWKLEMVEQVETQEQLAFIPSASSAKSIQNWIVNWLARKLQIPAQSVDPNQPFADYGLNSVMAVELAGELSELFPAHIKLDATLAWNFPTIESLACHLQNTLTTSNGHSTDKFIRPATLVRHASMASHTSVAQNGTYSAKQLSEEQVETLIAKELAELENLLGTQAA